MSGVLSTNRWSAWWQQRTHIPQIVADRGIAVGRPGTENWLLPAVPAKT